jgi:O-antigen/teichoic acid export membrane protein
MRLLTRLAGLGSEMFAVGAGQLGGLIGAIVVTKVLTSGLGDEQYGQFALAMTGPMLLQQFVFGPAAQAGLRFYPEHASAGTLRSLLDVLLRWLGMVSSAAAAGALIVAAILWARGYETWAALVPFALVVGLAQNYQVLFGSLQSAARRRVPMAVHQALEPAARALGSFVLMRWLGATTVVAAAGVALGSTIVMLSQRRSFQASAAPLLAASAQANDQETRRAMWAYGGNFAVWGLFAWAHQASDRWALKTFVDDEAVGIYAAAYQLASVPTILAGAALSQFVFPIAFARAGAGDSRTGLRSAARAVNIIAALFGAWVLAAVCVCWLAGTDLLVLFTSEQFRSGGPLIGPLALALGLMQLGHLLALVPLSAKDLGAYRSFKIGHAVCAMTLNVFGAWMAGLWGVVAASVAAAVMYATGACLINRWILDDRRVALAKA